MASSELERGYRAEDGSWVEMLDVADQRMDTSERTSSGDRQLFYKVARMAVRRVIVPSVLCAGVIPITANTALQSVGIDVFDYPTYGVSSVGQIKDDIVNTAREPFESWKATGEFIAHFGEDVGKVIKVVSIIVP